MVSEKDGVQLVLANTSSPVLTVWHKSERNSEVEWSEHFYSSTQTLILQQLCRVEIICELFRT